MSRRKTEEGLSTSFLDLLSCGLGGTIILFVLFAVRAKNNAAFLGNSEKPPITVEMRWTHPVGQIWALSSDPSRQDLPATLFYGVFGEEIIVDSQSQFSTPPTAVAFPVSGVSTSQRVSDDDGLMSASVTAKNGGQWIRTHRITHWTEDSLDVRWKMRIPALTPVSPPPNHFVIWPGWLTELSIQVSVQDRNIDLLPVIGMTELIDGSVNSRAPHDMTSEEHELEMRVQILPGEEPQLTVTCKQL